MNHRLKDKSCLLQQNTKYKILRTLKYVRVFIEPRPTWVVEQAFWSIWNLFND